MEPLSTIAIAPPQSPTSTRVRSISSDSSSTSGSGFADELGKAINSVEQLQQSADQQAQSLAQGKGNLHEAALALEKADISLRLATKVRNKFVEAYQEIMRMNV